MKKITKRITALLCCMVMLVTGVFSGYGNTSGVQATDTATISLTEGTYNFNKTSDYNYINVGYSGISDCSGWNDFFDETFAANYMQFAGGLDFNTLNTELNVMHLADNSTFQLFGYGSSGLTKGVSFTILKGAPILYNTTSGGTATVVLDANYTFTFSAPMTADTYNQVTVEKTDSLTEEKTISLTEGTYGFEKASGYNYINVVYSGLSDCGGWLDFFDETFATNYISFAGDLTYDTLNSELDVMHLADNTTFQLFGHGSNGLAEGASFTILKGAKFPYNNTAGGTSTVILDANYTFTFTAPTDSSKALNQVTVARTEIEEEAETISLVNQKYDFPVEGEYVNVNYSGIADFGGSLYQNFLDEEFSNNYVTYEGGLTYAELSTGLTRFCVETDSILQLLWLDRDKAFTVGASFTICQGAPIPYKNTAGETVTIPLDADYTFVFLASTSGGSVYNDVQVIKSTTFSFNESNHLTSGSSESAYTDLHLDDSNVANFDTAYTHIQDDDSYAEYIDIAGISYSKLSSMGVKFQFILDGTNRLLRIENWGELRSTLKVGDYMLFKKGMPLYYTTDGNTRYMKATLDSDYIYMVTDTTTDHNQYFKGMVYDASHHEYKLPDSVSTTSGTQGEDQIININFTPMDASCLYTGYAVDLLANSMAKNYIDFAGYSIEEAAAMCNAILISTADGTNVLQFQFNANAVNALEVGDMIILKKGLPIIYTNTSTQKIDTAILDDEYTFVVTNKYDDNGTTRLVFNCTLSGTYSLQSGEMAREEGAEKYVSVLYTDGCFADAVEFQGKLDNETVLKKYFAVSGKDCSALADNYWLQKYYVEALKGLRFYYNEFDLEDGDFIIFKKGLPISYTTTSGRTRTAYLDKDYGFRYDGTDWKFKYDATLIWQASETFGLKATETYNTYAENDYYITNIDLASGALDNAKNGTYITLEYETIKDYVQFGNSEWTADDFQFLVIRATKDLRVLQVRWDNAADSAKEGKILQLKKGLPVTYTATDGTKCTIKLDNNYIFMLQDSEDENVLCRLMPIGEYTVCDLDGNEKYNDNDVSLMRKAMVGLVNAYDFKIDMDESGAVTCQDLVALKKQSTGSEDPNNIYQYSTIYEDRGELDILAAGESITYEINQYIGNKNYVRLTFYATQNLTGYFTYTGTQEGATVEKTEDFYVEAGGIQFRQLFDNYRSNGLNVTDKTLKSITLTNVGEEQASVLLHMVESSPYTFDTANPEIKLDNGTLKIGMDLLTGGALTYLERLPYDGYTIQEVLKDKATTGFLWWQETYYNVAVGKNFSDGADRTLSNSVNLINIYDRGREIQQSFYADVDEENGYIRGNYEANESSGANWKYNPVQGGDQYDNSSQIIDYRVDEEKNLLYVKTRAMDWAQNNSTTKSYMENWYILDGNQLSVKNRFVDWNGFTGTWGSCSNEMPAVYLAQGLSTYVSQTAEGEDRQTALGPWTNDGGHKTTGSSEGWFAWVNEEDWGVGVYIPGIRSYLSGRSIATRYTNAKDSGIALNANANDSPMWKYGYLDEPTSEYTQCYVQNTSYTAPVLEAAMEEYVPLTYTYVIQVDELENIRNSFNALEEKNAVNNSGLRAWD